MRSLSFSRKEAFASNASDIDGRSLWVMVQPSSTLLAKRIMTKRESYKRIMVKRKKVHSKVNNALRAMKRP